MEQLPKTLNLLRNAAAAALEDGSDLLVLHQKWCEELPKWGNKPQQEKYLHPLGSKRKLQWLDGQRQTV